MAACRWCTTPVLLLFLSHGFLVRQCGSVVYEPIVSSYLSRLWGFRPALHPPGSSAPLRPHFTKTFRPPSQDSNLKPLSLPFYNPQSPGEAGPYSKLADPLGKSWSKSREGPRFGQPEVPLEGGLGWGRPQFHKRPLDTVGGSGFMKKAAGQAVEKRGLDQVGIGLIKRPLDHLGHGLFKKDSLRPGTEGEPFQHVMAGRLHSVPKESVEGKQSAVGLIKKGLDVLGTGLIRRGRQADPGSEELRTGLQQLSLGLGNGDPEKGVDADMVKRGLDHLGGGLLKRGLDTVGIGLIKRGVDDLDRGLSGSFSSQDLDDAGLGLLKEGLSHLATVLQKDGFDVDGVSMITRGALSLAAWLIQQQGNIKHIPSLDKKPDLNKKGYNEILSGLSKKSFDELGTGLIKKDKAASASKDKADDHGLDADFDDFGSGLFTKEHALSGNDPSFMATLNSLKYKYLKGFINQKTFADLRAAFERDDHRKMAKAFSKEVKPEVEGKGYNGHMPLRKKGLDEIGTGFIKKDLDYVGSGLIKKDVDEPEWKEFEDPEMIFKEKLGRMKKSPANRSPVGSQDSWSHKRQTDDKSPQIPLDKYGKKRPVL